MSGLTFGAISATGGLGVLVAGLIISHELGMGLESILGPALFIFVLAGGVALVMRSS